MRTPVFSTTTTDYVHIDCGRKKKYTKIRKRERQWFRNCLGCKAYIDDKCFFKYKIELILEDMNKKVTVHKPAELCKKCYTRMEFEKQKKLKRKK